MTFVTVDAIGVGSFEAFYVAQFCGASEVSSATV